MTDAEKIIDRFMQDESIPWRSGLRDDLSEEELAKVIEWGNNLFGLIRMVDHDHSYRVQAGDIGVDAGFVRSIRKAYEWWISPCEEVFRHIHRIGSYDEIDGQSALHRNFITTSKLILAPIEELVTVID